MFDEVDSWRAARPGRATVWEADGGPCPGVRYGSEIARRLAERGMPVSVVPLERRPPDAHELAAPLHVLSGGTTPAGSDEPWVRLAAEKLDVVLARARVGAAVVVGICFGAQLIARSAAGAGAVRPSPRGLEVGLRQVRCTASGARTLVAQFHHHEIDADRMVRSGATVTLTNDHSEVQGFELGPRVRGFQFHPELAPPAMESLLRANRNLLRSFGLGSREVLRSVRRRTRGWEDSVFDHLVLGAPGVPVSARAA